jgi:aspartate aminotransferase-like enzyme
MSSFAGVPIDLRKTDYDYIISSSNKNIQGMAGISFVICKTNVLEKSKAVKKRSYYLNLYQQYYFFDKKKQMQFTPPVQVLYALSQAIQEYFTEGEPARYRRYCDSWECLIAGLHEIGFRLLLPMEQQSKLLTAIIEPGDPKYQFDDMHDYLYARDFTIYPGKGAKQDTFRIANIGAIDKNDIEKFIVILKQFIKERGIKQF